MSLDLDRSDWQRVKFGDVVDRVREQRSRENVERYVAGGHFDKDSIEVRRWGKPDDGGMGSTFTYGFQPGHTLFVSASWYLRKVAVATFSGVVADKTYVLAPINDQRLDPSYLPWVLLTNDFYGYASTQSTGSMNARLLWSVLAKYEFDLPPIDQQRRIAELLWSLETALLTVKWNEQAVKAFSTAFADSQLRQLSEKNGQVPVIQMAQVSSGITLGPKRLTLTLKAPYLRVANVARGSISLEEVKLVGVTEGEQASKALTRGDILVVEGHGSAHEVGRAAMWRGEDGMLFQNHLFRIRANPECDGNYLELALNSSDARRYLRSVAKSTSGLNTINSTALSKTPIPRASLKEQETLTEKTIEIANAVQSVREEALVLHETQRCIIEKIIGGKP